MAIFVNPPKNGEEFTTLSKDWTGQTVLIDWEECYAKKNDESVLLYGMASTLKGVVNFQDKSWEFKPSLLMVALPLKGYTYKDKTVNPSEIAKLIGRFIDDGLLANDKAFKGSMRLDDTAIQFIEKLLTESTETPLESIKKECYVQAFLDGVLIESENKLGSKLPATSSGSKGSYKRVSLAEKNAEFLTLLKSQFPNIYTEETAKNLESVFEISSENETMLRILIAIMGMI